MMQLNSDFEGILNVREDRFNKQLKLINKYNMPIISFTLNLPGLIKNNDKFFEVHKEGISCIKKKLQDSNIDINDIEIYSTGAGNEAFFSCNSEVVLLKKLTVEIEETHELGRIFDMDVLDTKGNILDRNSLGKKPRKCLVCNMDAHFCVRNRTHSIEELNNIIYKKINNYFNRRN